MKVNITAIILVFISFISCKPDPEPETRQEIFDRVPKYFMSEDFKSYFAPAGEGSWYVYYDSLRGLYDTLTITEVGYPLGYLWSDPEITHISENYSISYSSTYTADEESGYYLDWGLSCSTTPSGNSYLNPDELMFSVYIQNDNNSSLRIHYGVESGYSITDYDQKISYVSEIEVQGIIYKDVLKIEQEDGLFYPMWFAKGIGPIRRVHSAAWTKDFQLIDYHLEPNPMGDIIGQYK